jgi:hypothetical protein
MATVLSGDRMCHSHESIGGKEKLYALEFVCSDCDNGALHRGMLHLTIVVLHLVFA